MLFPRGWVWDQSCLTFLSVTWAVGLSTAQHPPASAPADCGCQGTFPLVTATSWALFQSSSGANCIQQGSKMQQFIFSLTQVSISVELTTVPVCLSAMTELPSLSTLQFPSPPLDLPLYCCLQNAESRFCICGKSCWELSPLRPHFLRSFIFLSSCL